MDEEIEQAVDAVVAQHGRIATLALQRVSLKGNIDELPGELVRLMRAGGPAAGAVADVLHGWVAQVGVPEALPHIAKACMMAAQMRAIPEYRPEGGAAGIASRIEDLKAGMVRAVADARNGQAPNPND
jgi:hypothetical protein